MGRNDPCTRCGGLVADERISVHPSGVTVEYGRCLRCGVLLRRVLDHGDCGLLGVPARPWVEVSETPPALPPRPRRHLLSRFTRPPQRTGATRPRR